MRLDERVKVHADPRAQQVLTAAAASAYRAGTILHSGVLLLAVAHDGEVWPPQATELRAGLFVVEPPLSTEAFGDQMIRGVVVSREVETMLQEEFDRLPIRLLTVSDILWGLMESGGSDATALARSVSQERDPWAKIRSALGGRPPAVSERVPPRPRRPLRPARDEPVPERLVALLYLLIREDVPFGNVVKHVEALEGMGADPLRFGSKHAEALARELVERVCR